MPSDLYSILEQAREEDKAGNHSMALMKYKIFLKYESGDPQAWTDYAGLLLLMNRFDDSLRASGQALEIEPDFEPALINKAAALFGLEQFEEAKEIYKYLLTINPDRTECIFGLQKCLYKMGDTTSTESDMLKILNIDSSNMDAMQYLVSFYTLKNDKDKIKHWLEKIINLKFSGYESLWEKSVLLLRLGEYQEGFKLFEYRPANVNVPLSDEPIWNGESFPGRTL
ncbi:MAG: hypothetical protein LBH03_03310, partial [Holophagales bacterium]|nr:hypothetical protein [Holophagales bacterium]